MSPSSSKARRVPSAATSREIHVPSRVVKATVSTAGGCGAATAGTPTVSARAAASETT